MQNIYKEKSDVNFLYFSGLQVLSHSLTPRTRGVYLALRELHQYFDAVYDVTVAYNSTRKYSHTNTAYYRDNATGMVDFIQSYSPKMHMNVRRLDIGTVPNNSEEEVTLWLHCLFERKDRYVL